MEPTKAKDLFESGISYVTMSRSCIAFQRLGDWLRTDKMVSQSMSGISVVAKNIVYSITTQLKVNHEN